VKPHKKHLLAGLLALCVCPIASHAADMFGNPTAIGTPRRFEIEIGGGRSSDLDLDVTGGTATTQIASAAVSRTAFAESVTVKEDQAFVRLGYALNSRVQLFASLGTGKDEGRRSSSRAIGVKLSPDTESSALRVGLMLRAQQVKRDDDGRFVLPQPFDSASDGVDVYVVQDRVSGTKRIEYSRLDAFFGASAKTGLFRLYGGVGVSRISGTYTVALDDTIGVISTPVGGGPLTTSTQRVTFNRRSDISGSGYVSGVLGLSVRPNDDSAITAEMQVGVQRAFMLSGTLWF